MSESTQLLEAISEIRDLVRLMAEPQIAARDQKLRDELIRIVGRTESRGRVVLLMNGSNTQAMIHSQTGFHRGNLSTLIKELSKHKLIVGDPKQPKLAISVPSDFFSKANS